jgi:hypothetical protein
VASRRHQPTRSRVSVKVTTIDSRQLFGPRRIWVVLMAGLATTACAPAEVDQLANGIRAADSPIVREVTVRSANVLDPARIYVRLVAGTTEAQADELWCDVIASAGDSGLAYQTVAVWNDAGTERMALDPVCSTPSS